MYPQVPHIPPTFKGTRIQHLLRRLRQLLCCYILIDISESFIESNLHLYPIPPNDATTIDKSEPKRSITVLIFIFTAYSMSHAPYIILSILTNILHIGHPEDWPDMYGKWRDAYSIRNLWGYVRTPTHILLRR